MRLVSVAAAAMAAVVSALSIGEADQAETLPEPVLTVIINEAGTASATGTLPEGVTARTLRDAIPGVDTSALSSGASGDAEAWELALTGLAAVAPRLRRAVIRIENTTIRVSATLTDGFAAGDAAAAIRTVAGPGWDYVLEIAEAPPPAVFAMVKIDPAMQAPDEAETRPATEIAGILPDPIDETRAREITGIQPGDRAAISAGAEGDAAHWERGLAGLAAMAPYFLRLDARLQDDLLTAEGRLAPGYGQAEVEDAFAAAAGRGWDIALTTTETQARDGDTRIAAETGALETYSNGFWLALPSFDPTPLTCTLVAERALADEQITFVTGSAEIDRAAGRILDRLAALALHCLPVTERRLKVAGHTDTVGLPFANLRLSLKRAQNVVAALIERGVAPGALVALGYGPFRPVAENSTAEGRAKNRRITFVFVD